MNNSKESHNNGIIGPILEGFYLHDLVQVIVGATLLAIPVGFTQEVWEMGEKLPLINVGAFFLMAVTFISIFTYYHYHSHHEKVNKRWPAFIKRVLITYLFSLITVGIILTVIDQAPWQLDLFLAIKRVVIVAFPASMSAAVADTLK